jgi:integrase
MSAYTVSVGKVRTNKHRGNFILGWELLYKDGTKPSKFSASCDREGPLADLREKLLDASRRGLAFDIQRKGLPAGVERPGPKTDPAIEQAARAAASAPAFAVVAARAHKRWPGRVGNTGRTDLDGLVMTFEAMLRADAPEIDRIQAKTLREYLREALTPPAVLAQLADARDADDARRAASRLPEAQLTASQLHRRRRTDAARLKRRMDRAERLASAAEYYNAHALRWEELDEAAALRIVSRLRRKADGSLAAHNTVARRLITCNEMFDWAARQKHISDNPIRLLEKDDLPSTSIKIRPVELRRVQSFTTILLILHACEELGQRDPIARMLTAYFALVALAALRPSEARNLMTFDIHLPDTDQDWGSLVLHGSICTVGRRHTPDGGTDRRGGLKWRDPDAERIVMVPPHLVTVLRRLLATRGHAGATPVFLRPDGILVTTNEILAVWHSMKAIVFADDPALARSLDVYDLRHARLSHQLATKDLDDAWVAAQAGNTVPTLRTTYQGPISAGANGAFARDLELFYDEIVPPEQQRRIVTAAMLEEHQRHMVKLATAVLNGEQGSAAELMASMSSINQPPIRTVAAERQQRLDREAG